MPTSLPLPVRCCDMAGRPRIAAHARLDVAVRKAAQALIAVDEARNQPASWLATPEGRQCVADALRLLRSAVYVLYRLPVPPTTNYPQ